MRTFSVRMREHGMNKSTAPSQASALALAMGNAGRRAYCSWLSELALGCLAITWSKFAVMDLLFPLIGAKVLRCCVAKPCIYLRPLL